MLPIVLVTQRLVRASAYPELRECLDIRWATFLVAAGFTPVALPVSIDPRPYFEMQPAGLILTGGNSLASVCEDPLSQQRDTFELPLLDLARENRVPVLGVCRGMQLMALHAAGTLEHCQGHVATEHLLRCEPGSWLDGLVEEDFLVNSYHSFGIASGGDQIAVSATSPDGCIEAIEYSSYGFGIMWHPERYSEPRNVDIDLIRKALGS